MRLFWTLKRPAQTPKKAHFWSIFFPLNPVGDRALSPYSNGPFWWQLKTVEVLRKKPWSWIDWLGGNSQNQNRGNQAYSHLIFERHARPSGLLPPRIITCSPSILPGCLHNRGLALWALWAKTAVVHHCNPHQYNLIYSCHICDMLFSMLDVAFLHLFCFCRTMLFPPSSVVFLHSWIPDYQEAKLYGALSGHPCSSEIVKMSPLSSMTVCTPCLVSMDTPLGWMRECSHGTPFHICFERGL